MKKNIRGGKRQGAGRPNLGKTTLHCRVEPKTLVLIKEWATAQGVSQGEVVEELVFRRNAPEIEPLVVPDPFEIGIDLKIAKTKY